MKTTFYIHNYTVDNDLFKVAMKVSEQYVKSLQSQQ